MYTTKRLRDDLWAWGDAVKHGYWRGHVPADPDTPRLAVHFGSRLPCHADHLDISRAFASLNPALPKQISDLGFYRATNQLSRQQLTLWLYYVDGWGLTKFRQDWQAMSVPTRTLMLELDTERPGVHVVPEDGRGDELIAARLRVSRATVERDRHGAINAMVAFLNPKREERAA